MARKNSFTYMANLRAKKEINKTMQTTIKGTVQSYNNFERTCTVKIDDDLYNNVPVVATSFVPIANDNVTVVRNNFTNEIYVSGPYYDVNVEQRMKDQIKQGVIEALTSLAGSFVVTGGNPNALKGLYSSETFSTNAGECYMNGALVSFPSSTLSYNTSNLNVGIHYLIINSSGQLSVVNGNPSLQSNQIKIMKIEVTDETIIYTDARPTLTHEV